MGVRFGRLKGGGKSKVYIYRPKIEVLLANGSAQAFIAKRYVQYDGG
ncbi:MAG: hypothetical protein BroJett018_21430 [Chloroflexota bacterium]|nr:MAG: hypothetical protein BroJett018_21430 [Chloroflexota bacterium]